MIAGDARPAEALGRVRELFGPIPAKTTPEKATIRLEPVHPQTLDLKTERPFGMAVFDFAMAWSQTVAVEGRRSPEEDVQAIQRVTVDRVRAILAGGQAVVLHRLALMSKDGDWILREERLTRYMEAARPWAAAWPALSRQIEGLTLSDARQWMIQRAETLLPFAGSGGWP